MTQYMELSSTGWLHRLLTFLARIYDITNIQYSFSNGLTCSFNYTALNKVVMYVLNSKVGNTDV